MRKITAQNPQQKLINDATDATSLAGIYHEQCKALFHAISSMPETLEYRDTIKKLCEIGSLLADEASNAADCSFEAFKAVQS